VCAAFQTFEVENVDVVGNSSIAKATTFIVMASPVPLMVILLNRSVCKGFERIEKVM
jgi:hypothetical protein